MAMTSSTLGQAAGSWALERSGSSCQPPRKSHMQADAPPRRSAHPNDRRHPQGYITHNHLPPIVHPQALFALLSPLLSQAFASVFLDVLPDSPVDLVVWHTMGRQASMASCRPPPP